MSKRRSIRTANHSRQNRRNGGTTRKKGRSLPVLPDYLTGETNLTTSGATRKVTLLRGRTIEYPELYLKVFVEADTYETPLFGQMFGQAYCRRADKPEEASLVVFGGGSDVDPVLYGERPHKTTHCSPLRDSRDMELYAQCLEEGIPMMGVCRGAQFLWVMNGGKLYQDVNNHYGDHSMWDLHNKRLVGLVSSVHHQMCAGRMENAEVIACSRESTRRDMNDAEYEDGKKADIESFFIRDTCAFGVQGHPEYSRYPEFTAWTLNMINDLIITNPDVTWRNNCLRLHPDIVKQRDQKIPLDTPSVTVN